MMTQSKELVRANSDVLAPKKPGVKTLLRDKRGAGMTEYIILVGVIAMLAIVAFRFFGSSVSKKIQEQGDVVKNIKTPT
jgi:Flp pilus assembly pilin Flp